MTREQAEQIAASHFGGALPHYIADWVVPAIMEAVAIEREAMCAAIKAEDDFTVENGDGIRRDYQVSTGIVSEANPAPRLATRARSSMAFVRRPDDGMER